MGELVKKEMTSSLATTEETGEEGDDPGVPSDPIILDPINTQYNRLLELVEKNLTKTD
jgi:hypothetical protein